MWPGKKNATHHHLGLHGHRLDHLGHHRRIHLVRRLVLHRRNLLVHHLVRRLVRLVHLGIS